MEDTSSEPKYYANTNYPNTVIMGEVDYSNLPYIISLFVLILSLLIFFLWRKTKSARTDILLTGLSDSGKTYLFSQFLFNVETETFSSISTNVGEYSSGDKGPIRFVDIPGNDRLRNKFLGQYRYLAKGIIFVIDSVTFQKDIRDVADFLYSILADNETIKAPVIIFCNKQDVTMAKGSSVIKTLLEKELNLVRTTRANRLQSVDNTPSSEDAFLGKQNKDFAFAHLSYNVDIIEGSAKKRDFKSLVEWVEKL